MWGKFNIKYVYGAFNNGGDVQNEWGWVGTYKGAVHI